MTSFNDGYEEWQDCPFQMPSGRRAVRLKNGGAGVIDTKGSSEQAVELVPEFVHEIGFKTANILLDHIIAHAREA